MRPTPKPSDFKERQNSLRFQLIVTELDLALTFFRIATSAAQDSGAHDQDRAERNFNNANQAVSSAQRFLKQVHLTSSMRSQVRDRIRVLQPFLERGWTITDEP